MAILAPFIAGNLVISPSVLMFQFIDFNTNSPGEDQHQYDPQIDFHFIHVTLI